MSDTSLTIRVSRSTHELLRDLAAKSKASITAVVDEAVHDLQRKKFWADFNAACESLQAEPEAWADRRARALRVGAVAGVVFAVCWIQPLIEQFTSDGPGNLTRLVDSGRSSKADARR